MFRELDDNYNLEVNVKLISSNDNMANSLIRIHGWWMRMLKLNDLRNCTKNALIDKVLFWKYTSRLETLESENLYTLFGRRS